LLAFPLPGFPECSKIRERGPFPAGSSFFDTFNGSVFDRPALFSVNAAFMADPSNSAPPRAAPGLVFPAALRLGLILGLSIFLASLLAALFLPKGFALAAFGDTVQVGLIAAVAVISFANFWRTRARLRIFWFLIFTGSLLWTISNGIWAVYELWFARPVPDVAIVDILLFVKVVPLTAAIAIAPDRHNETYSRAFGLLDVFVLMIFSLYLFAFGVFAYRLLPGAQASYDFYFNLADAIGNQALLITAGFAILRSTGCWRAMYRLGFFACASYGLGSNLSNFEIDAGRYYTGSVYDVPLVASLVAFFSLALIGGTFPQDRFPIAAPESEPTSPPSTFLSEHLAMLVALSTPIVGIWLLSDPAASPQLRSFRISITLITILLVTLLLAIKQDILATGLFQSLQRLSETHGRIEQFKSHLTQSEKLAALGTLVAHAATQIKACMATVLSASSQLTSRPDSDTRIHNLAGKIGQYAQRTDALVDNMLHFAQETPLCLAPLDIKPVLESALHLSRVAKIPQLRVNLSQEGNCPQVRGDSSQLLHVFLQLISNAVDVLQEAGGGAFDITIRASESQVILEFADSGPGLKEPQRVFEPFYTTKPVGKGTGLGLSTCYGIIQQHNGEISCHNRPEGGAVFSIFLPCIVRSASDLVRAPAALRPEPEGVR
jgi:signal transduction histidine kinase